jgi:hypothetical protein
MGLRFAVFALGLVKSSPGAATQDIILKIPWEVFVKLADHCFMDQYFLNAGKH